MRQPARPAAFAALAIALSLVGAAGCSDDSSAPGTTSAAASASADSKGSTDAKGSAPTSAGTSSSSSSSSSSSKRSAGDVLLGADALPTPAADHCRTADLTATARSTGQGKATVTITNKSAHDCSVRGYPSLLFVGKDGHTELPVDWAGSATAAQQYTLSPGDSAAARLTFYSETECAAFTALDLVPPGEARRLAPAFAEPVRICDTGVRVTAFQAVG
jgi:hypothetical protein